VRLYGEGSGDGRISVTPTVLFSTNPCNVTIPSQEISVNNYGQASMQIFSIGVEGADAAEFSVTSEPLPIRVEPGEKKTFTVAFTPLKNGVKDARVVVSSSAINAPNGRSVTQISARRDSVGFELSRTLVDFANVREGQELIERILLLNTGTVALRWPRTSVTIGRFRIESITPEVTQPGERSNLTVRFLGGTAGTVYQESYTFTDSICGTTEQLLLRASVKSYIGATLRIGSVQTTSWCTRLPLQSCQLRSYTCDIDRRCSSYEWHDPHTNWYYTARNVRAGWFAPHSRYNSNSSVGLARHNVAIHHIVG
jgi:hypothetical protein